MSALLPIPEEMVGITRLILIRDIIADNILYNRPWPKWLTWIGRSVLEPILKHMERLKNAQYQPPDLFLGRKVIIVESTTNSAKITTLAVLKVYSCTMLTGPLCIE